MKSRSVCFAASSQRRLGRDFQVKMVNLVRREMKSPLDKGCLSLCHFMWILGCVTRNCYFLFSGCNETQLSHVPSVLCSEAARLADPHGFAPQNEWLPLGVRTKPKGVPCPVANAIPRGQESTPETSDSRPRSPNKRMARPSHAPLARVCVFLLFASALGPSSLTHTLRMFSAAAAATGSSSFEADWPFEPPSWRPASYRTAI